MATAKKGSKSSKKASTAKRSTSGTKAKAGKSSGTKKRSAAGGKRTLIDTGTDKRFVRRRGDGTFKESDDVGRSLAADRRTKAKTRAKSGQGDRGDRKR